MKRVRLDALVLARGLADDEKTARGLVMSGRIMLTEPNRGEVKCDKAGTLVDPSASVRIAGANRRYASRAGEKLDAALDHFGVDATGLVCADLGLSTGGFTDCLLQRGAARVHGVDLAQGIVDWRVRSDDRVVLHERTDARTVTQNDLGEAVQLVTIDISLVSLVDLLPTAASLLDDGRIVALIKPQYEVARGDLVDGIVVDDAARSAAAARVVEAAEALGLEATRPIDSPVHGTKGNREMLACFGRTS